MMLTYEKIDLHKTYQDRILTGFGDCEVCVCMCAHVCTLAAAM